MEAEDPLSQLADIHLPAEIPFWPPAPGWWALAALLLLALALLGRRQLQRLLLQRKLARALHELEQVHSAWQRQQGSDTATRNAAGLELLYGFNKVLKRVALVTTANPEVPRLTGAAWLRFLDSCGKGSEFTTGVGRVLADGTYRPAFNADVDALHELCRRQVKAFYLQSAAAPVVAEPPASEASA